MEHATDAPTITANIDLAIGTRRLRAAIKVPTGPMRLVELLPVIHAVADAVVAAGVADAEAAGERLSCRKGCAACCRHLVPVAEVEARRIRDLVAELPEPRRSAVRERFAEVRRRLEAAGLLRPLLQPETITEDERGAAGVRYFLQAIPCPFLEEEACSIYAERPLSCRDYVVTSPPENCSLPTPETVRRVPLAINMWQAMDAAGERAGPRRPWVPLALAPEWADAHPDMTAPRPGPEILRQVFESLTGKELPQATPAPGVDAAGAATGTP